MSVLALTLQYIVVDFAMGVLRWPIWWYTKGLVLTVKWAQRSVVGYARTSGLVVWVKNIFVPMYGLRDWQGRLISFLVRLVQIIFRGFLLFFYSIFIILLLVVYIAAPVVAVILVLYHLVGTVL